MAATVSADGMKVDFSGFGADVSVDLSQLGAVVGDTSNLVFPGFVTGGAYIVACYSGGDVTVASEIGVAMTGVKVAWGQVYDKASKAFKTDVGIGSFARAMLMDVVWKRERAAPVCRNLTLCLFD